jgi:hypothetical protein
MTEAPGWMGLRWRAEDPKDDDLEATVEIRSEDGGRSFLKAAAWSKADLSRHGDVTSIEGSALARRPDGGWELFVALEKDVAYPDSVAALQKPGTGVGSIDRLTGPRPDALDAATQAIRTMLGA